MSGDSPGTPTLLVLRALKLGDLLVAVPALKGLRAAFPRHELLLASPAWLRPVVNLISAIDGLVPLPDLQSTVPDTLDGVDVAVNFHGNGVESRALLESLRPLHRIGHEAPGWDGPAWCEELHERERWVTLLGWHGITADANDVAIARPSQPAPIRRAAVIHVGASHGSRHWPVERFAAVARALTQQGDTVILTGDDNDAPRAAEVARLAQLPPLQNLAGHVDLAGFAALVAAAKVVVSVDTGAAHLASAYGTPSVVLFGPAAQSQWGPPPGPHVVLTDESVRCGEVFSPEPDPALLAVSAAHVLAGVIEVTRRLKTQ